MELAKFLEFLRANKRLVITVSLAAFAICWAQSCRPGAGTGRSQILTLVPGMSNFHVTVTRPVRMPQSVWPAPSLVPPPPPAPGPKANAMLSLHAEVPAGETNSPSGPYSPFGRLLQCVLVNSFDSGLPD